MQHIDHIENEKIEETWKREWLTEQTLDTELRRVEQVISKHILNGTSDLSYFEERRLILLDLLGSYGPTTLSMKRDPVTGSRLGG